MILLKARKSGSACSIFGGYSVTSMCQVLHYVQTVAMSSRQYEVMTVFGGGEKGDQKVHGRLKRRVKTTPWA